MCREGKRALVARIPGCGMLSVLVACVQLKPFFEVQESMYGAKES